MLNIRFDVILKKFFDIVFIEYAVVSYFAALAGGKYPYIPPAIVERITE